MASKQDRVIEDEESEQCPLCIEELDLSDKGFRPCPCGYQICQFCYNNIKTTMNGLCPACRRRYDEENIRFEVPSAEETARFKENKSHQEKRRAAAKRQEAASKTADILSRKHLAGIRVRRQNLVYVTGLRLNTSDPSLSEKLRGIPFFGQYGEIHKIVVNRPKDSKLNQPVGVYITYYNREAATSCIHAVNGSINAGSTLRADYGTTKYCSAFLRHEICSNKNCTFLHEVGEEKESFTREGLSSLNASGTQSTAVPTLTGASGSPNQASTLLPNYSSPPFSKFDADSDSESVGFGSITLTDRASLPPHVSWAQPRHSISGRRPSPTPAAIAENSSLSSSISCLKEAGRPRSESDVASIPQENVVVPDLLRRPVPYSDVDKPSSATSVVKLLSMQQILSQGHNDFFLDESMVKENDLQLIRHLPLLFDPNGGARRFLTRMLESKRAGLEKERVTSSQTLPTSTAEDVVGSGSLQLGGEPDDLTEEPASAAQLTAIKPPADEQSNTLRHERSSISMTSSPNTETTTPQLKQYSLGQAKTPFVDASKQATVLDEQRQSTRFMSGFAEDHRRSTSYQNAVQRVQPEVRGKLSGKDLAHQYQIPQNSTLPLHNNTVGHIPIGTTQGPPPGLRSNAAASIGGGGMFGQGHGFATSVLGYGVVQSSRNANDDLLHELLKHRGGNSLAGHSTGTRRSSKVADANPLRTSIAETGFSAQATPGQGPGGLNPDYSTGGFGRW